MLTYLAREVTRVILLPYSVMPVIISVSSSEVFPHDGRFVKNFLTKSALFIFFSQYYFITTNNDTRTFQTYLRLWLKLWWILLRHIVVFQKRLRVILWLSLLKLFWFHVALFCFCALSFLWFRHLILLGWLVTPLYMASFKFKLWFLIICH